MPNYCQDDLPEYADNNCQVYQLAGIADVAIIEPNNPLLAGMDWEDIEGWEEMIADGFVRFIKDVNVNISDPSDVQVANPIACGPDNIKIKANYEVTINDANVSTENDAFYAALDGRTTNLAVFYCNEGNFRVISVPVTWSSPMPNGADQNSLQTYKVKGMFTLPKGVIPTLYTTPAGLLDL